MPLNFNLLIPQIVAVLDEIEDEFRAIPGLILTESDLKCIVYKKLTAIPELSRPSPTEHRHILGTAVHTELPWFDEGQNGRPAQLRIIPDITIIEPEHLRILGRPRPFGATPPNWMAANPPLQLLAEVEQMPLPHKQFAFNGKAITFELKFVRCGITASVLDKIKQDYDQMMRLFAILDRRGEGDTLFSYLVIFCKYGRLTSEQLAYFLGAHESSNRHRIVYKTGRVSRRFV